jgi:hypothetical protein
VSVAGANKGTGEVASVGTGECLIAGIGAGDCPVAEVVASVVVGACAVAGIVAGNDAVAVEVAGGVASIVADAFAVTGVIAHVAIGACLVVFKISDPCCGVDVLIVVVVGSSIGGVCGGNSTLGLGIFILVRGGVGGLGGKERLDRSSPFNHSSKSSLNSC